MAVELHSDFIDKFMAEKKIRHPSTRDEIYCRLENVMTNVMIGLEERKLKQIKIDNVREELKSFTHGTNFDKIVMKRMEKVEKKEQSQLTLPFLKSICKTSISPNAVSYIDTLVLYLLWLLVTKSETKTIPGFEKYIAEKDLDIFYDSDDSDCDESDSDDCDDCDECDECDNDNESENESESESDD